MAYPTPQEITAKVAALDRSPFQSLLEEFLGCPPSREAIQALADTDPKKWTEAMKLVANMAGYHDKAELHVHGHIAVLHMSDSQLEAELERLGARLPPRLFPHLLEDENK